MQDYDRKEKTEGYTFNTSWWFYMYNTYSVFDTHGRYEHQARVKNEITSLERSVANATSDSKPV